MTQRFVPGFPRLGILVAAMCLLAAGANVRAAGEVYWQLTFSYSAQGLALVKAAAIPPTVKKLSTPGVEGAIVRLEYDLEWLDAAGAVLGRVPVVVPVGTRVALTAEGDPRVHGSCLPDEGGFVLRVPRPAGAAVRSVRLRKRLAGIAAAGVGAPLPPEPELPIAFAPAEQTFPLVEAKPLAAAGTPSAGPIGVQKVRDNGPDDNRLVIVMMSDGYTLANLDTGAFSNKVTSFLNFMFGISPWDAYQNGANVYRVDIVSNQQGADYEDNSPQNGGTLKDTYLGGAFWTGGIERCCFLSGDGTTRAFAAADDFVGVGVWDEILVFVNSFKYGGCGGAVGVSTVNSSSDEIQVHEFGHSFAGLADEYSYGSISTNCPGTTAANADCGLNFPSVKWDAWVTPGTPMPTPDTSTYNNVVGAFEGAVYQTKGVFRPKRDCRMRTLSVVFCPVCKQQHIVRLFEQVGLADDATPPFGNAEVPATGTRQFSVANVDVGGMSYQWTLAGVEMAGETNSSVVLSSAQVPAPDTELLVTITHTNAMIRGPVIQGSYSWRLSVANLPSLAVSDATLTEGDVGANDAVFQLMLSFPWPEPVQVDFATVDGTARAGADYVGTAGTLTFASLQTTQTVIVPVLGDTLPEPSEVFFLRLTNPTNALLSTSQGACLIHDDDNPPAVTLSAPTNGVVVTAGDTVTLTAGADDADGRITLVEFFADGLKVGEDSFTPFTAAWSPLTAGWHALTAVAQDDAGRSATSAPVSIIVVSTPPPGLVLLPVISAWRYDATTNDYGTAWRDPGFDDNAWSGPANAVFYNELAALPAATNTWLPLTNFVRLRGYYFRTHFTFPSNPAPEVTLTTSNLVDDGAVFYLNGFELDRLRMPSGTIVRTTLASSSPRPNGDATSFEVLRFPADHLVAGDNLLAVEVHQQSDASSDVVFALSLTAEPGRAPLIADDSQLTNRVVEQGRVTTFGIATVGSPVVSYQWFRDGVAIGDATAPAYAITSMNSALAGTYFCRVSNSLGVADSRTLDVSYVADTEPPVVVGVIRNLDLTSFVVSFSEPIDASGVDSVANYSLTPVGGGASLMIQSAALWQGTNILLTTSPADPAANYLLTIAGGLSDFWGNALLPGAEVSVASEVLLVAADEQSWRHFEADHAPGAGWWAAEYDDAQPGWTTGTALFDAKRPAGRTTVGPNAVPVRTSLDLTNPPGASEITLAWYFRTHFTVPDGVTGARLQLRAFVDDGAAFYLNGAEIFRLGMPAYPAPLAYDTPAARSVSDSQNVFEGPFEVPATNLVEGDNVLAVEVHQDDENSSDVSFAAELVGILPGVTAPPTLWMERSGDAVRLWWSNPAARLQHADQLPGGWHDVTPPPTNTFLFIPDQPARFYRLRVN